MPATSPDNVFVNCPFDEDYAEAFQALIFAIRACGFLPRSARELDDSGQARSEKLYGLIEECRYGIHDISRTELDRINQLPRFNMPLELGIFIVGRRLGTDPITIPRCNPDDALLSPLHGHPVHCRFGNQIMAIDNIPRADLVIEHALECNLHLLPQ